MTMEEKLSFLQEVWNLSDTEEAKLGEFKELCRQQALYTPAGENGHPHASHDDSTLLRFLRARKFDLRAALAMFTNTCNWRKTNRIDDLYTSFPVTELEKSRAYYPQWTGHRDRNGVPLYVYTLSSLSLSSLASFYKDKSASGSVSVCPLPQRLQRLVTIGEYVENYVTPLCSSIPHRPNPQRSITTTTNIVDISGVSLSQFWSLKSHLQAASELVTSHYPESLERVFVIGAPTGFSKIWSWAKGWFDPATTGKIFVLSKEEERKVLLEHIAENDLPVRYGGRLEWEFGMAPMLDEGIWSVLDREALPEGPAMWVDGRTVLVGSADGKLRA